MLITTAWLAGAPGHGGVGCGSCSSCPSCPVSCDTCCESEGLFAKLRNKFKSKGEGKYCEMDCGCDNPTLRQRIRDCFRKNDCCDTCPAPKAPPSCCDSCDKPGLWDRIKARFRKSDCCDSAPSCC